MRTVFVVVILFAVNGECGYFYPIDCKDLGKRIREEEDKTTDEGNALNSEDMALVLSSRHTPPLKLETFSKNETLTIQSKHFHPMLDKYWTRVWQFKTKDNHYVYTEDEATVHLWTIDPTANHVMLFFCVEEPNKDTAVFVDVATKDGNITYYELSDLDKKFRKIGYEMGSRIKMNLTDFTCLCLRPSTGSWDVQFMTDLGDF